MSKYWKLKRERKGIYKIAVLGVGKRGLCHEFKVKLVIIILFYGQACPDPWVLVS